MEIKKEDPSKVIIIPRPPRANNQEWVPINPDAVSAPEDADAAESDADPIAPVAPGAGPLHNQVEGPAQGLAGIPTPKTDEE